MKRRLPGLLLVLVAVVGVVVASRNTAESSVPQFSVTTAGWMPSAPAAGGLIESWFCPGVPATGVDGVDGEIVIANRGGQSLEGTVLVLNDDAESRRLDLLVDPWTTATLDLDETLPGAITGAVVEIEGGGALVEQVALSPDGNSYAACANATSDAWYLADGFTVEGSIDQVILTNPFEQTVVANLSFSTQEGYREPGSYRGLTVPPRSIRVVDLGAPGAGAQSEPVLAVDVEVTRGRLVVGRSQDFVGGGRSGTQVSLGSPVTREQWWFSNGASGPGIDEEYVIYNPTSQSVEVDVLFIGIETPVLVDPIEVPARQVVTYDSSTQEGLPDGGHAVVFATASSEPSIVVDRVITETDGEVRGTGVLTGALARNGYVASTWYVPRGPEESVSEAIVIYNVDNEPGTVTVSAVGTSGPVPIEGLIDVDYGAAGRVSLDLDDPLIAGRQLIVEGTTRIMVERSFPNGVGGLRTPSWAIPQG
ncbi:hypothetical protein BDK89_3033 [Ilumatobacter fluminis]|uniref:Uncharacterized protein n=1 Tax=Ilumatobacter fluminis TaxID=467091 RepID=A0A4R7I1V3_9ACTN|nr:DUF5719 family protein [Ilumatobacter fluminis]TDT17425.1 hypothetical protein BDK89_3033 [Ilumatobacter fluminis]